MTNESNIKQCKYCEKDFEYKSSKALYCSNSCKQKQGYINDRQKRIDRVNKWREDNPEKFRKYRQERYDMENYGRVIDNPLDRHKDRFAKAKALGYRSGLEVKVARQLDSLGVDGEYEKHKVKFTQPAKARTYTPDFNLNRKIWIDTKGRFTTEDRMKFIYIKQSNPDLDIRLVFNNSKAKINKGSKTTYGMWCEKHKFLYADKLIPQAWIDEAFASEDKDGD